ncbi:MAG: YegS/Rv2252/BmrU family lipid kinase [Clostridium tyrobutyricum]|jgi:YegS/Rv2252/BmrU family lipid kinase|uniref:YegS/Rv2252/BmrU family lipid kinase n=1 Tax=Clostridium tyrobutyricum TaxID=1519 RepID=UPI0002DD8039|nr:YegS/Rv2252/BmrU family lipid kinase [Clostridium tyrobutyricum]MBV4415732.1 YegS/Rv2252/BmrU family lipid kinase [Clostridium tyrobutyricum]MBV4424715.1 YegS/Rv2252/BmrU family lipid kinase [Clostridium tyrobutyricum]MBV4436650.1 YegS/Rv2252/BmrU family lipid kinase [Clostridium tyrobutyricum]MBV4440333.1 YegS/Rv2252/BmrU family lipid kinase [Clostridium tyrobutyricum]MCH4200224.1 YegS/Rv2252/BmrU family lipid kinase [Clostridium tyrobutyricum]
MNKVKFIYNPYSGESNIISNIDNVIMIHQKYGYEVMPFRIGSDYSIEETLKEIDETYKYVLIAGGDGTVDNVVNHMKKLNINIPIAILPVGTANDFAKFIGMPHKIKSACEQILNSSPKSVDIGKINDKYFINVASAGLFTDVSQKIDINLKNTIGKLAYYVKGLEQLPSLRNIKVKVKSEDAVFDGDMYLFMVFNGQTAGNLKFAYKAEIDDGMLDVIIVKAVVIKDIITIFIKMIRGDHLENTPGLVYFKANKLEIECDEGIVTDIDGERGPDFPLSIECVKHGIQVLGINNPQIIK